MEINEELRQSLVGGTFTETACSADTFSIYNLSDCYWAGRTRACDSVVIAESPVYGKILFLDGEVQSAESDEAIYHEHLVHPVLNAMAERREKRVLIVGGGEGATAREVLKWGPESVAHVDWVDYDGDLVDLCRRHLSYADDPVYNDPRIHFFPADIRAYWASNNAQYDIVILDLPDPDVESITALREPLPPGEYNLYDCEFWRTVCGRLTPGGAIVSHCGPIAPGADEDRHRAGLAWIQSLGEEFGPSVGHSYHTFIPSFQSQWSFWMSVAPSSINAFPPGLAVMDTDAQTAAFHWPRFWFSPYVGHAGQA
jgi:spermidine synthase